ncbi:hypothetical protein RCL1_001549 [Eukaryota sp. TZLM3-RCL]
MNVSSQQSSTFISKVDLFVPLHTDLSLSETSSCSSPKCCCHQSTEEKDSCFSHHLIEKADTDDDSDDEVYVWSKDQTGHFHSCASHNFNDTNHNDTFTAENGSHHCCSCNCSCFQHKTVIAEENTATNQVLTPEYSFQHFLLHSHDQQYLLPKLNHNPQFGRKSNYLNSTLIYSHSKSEQIYSNVEKNTTLTMFIVLFLIVAVYYAINRQKSRALKRQCVTCSQKCNHLYHKEILPAQAMDSIVDCCRSPHDSINVSICYGVCNDENLTRNNG